MQLASLYYYNSILYYILLLKCITNYDSVILALQTGHLVHVAVTIFDDNDNPVINLGLVNPWMCEASLVSNQDR